MKAGPCRYGPAPDSTFACGQSESCLLAPAGIMQPAWHLAMQAGAHVLLLSVMASLDLHTQALST